MRRDDGDMAMFGLDVGAGPVPSQQCLDREGVPTTVKPRTRRRSLLIHPIHQARSVISRLVSSCPGERKL